MTTFDDNAVVVETTYSRLVSRRKIYGSTVGTGEEETTEHLLLNTADFLDDAPVGSTSLFAANGEEEGHDAIDNDRDSEDDEETAEPVEEEEKSVTDENSLCDSSNTSDKELPNEDTNSFDDEENEAEFKDDEEKEAEFKDDDEENTLQQGENHVDTPHDAPSRRPCVQPSHDALVASIDTLFCAAQVETVTVKDILVALQQEYQTTFTKATKHFVKTRLVDLVRGHVQPHAETRDEEEEEENEESEVEGDDDEEEEAEVEEEEASDFEEETKQKKKKSTNNKKKKQSATVKRPRRRQTKKPSALRIHAEQLRKKRMEELRVRNEELQMEQDQVDQERANQIAARFETDTDELRLKRLEDRLDLLQKLNHKRIQVLAGVPGTTLTSEDSDEELEIVGPQQPHLATVLSVLPPTLDRAPPIHVSWELLGTQAQKSPGRSLSARAALRTALLSKQRRMGNLWLARELGYKSEQEHLQDCYKAEQQKRAKVLSLEQERLQASERKQLRERMLLEQEEKIGQEDDDDDDDESYKEGSSNEEDEEVALAQELAKEEELENGDTGATRNDEFSVEDEHEASDDEKSMYHPDDDDQTVSFPPAHDDDETAVAFPNHNDDELSEQQEETPSLAPESQALPQDASQEETDPSNPRDLVNDETVPAASDENVSEKDFEQGESSPQTEDTPKKDGAGEPETEEVARNQKNKARNSAWLEMLKKEKEKMNKLKKKGSSLVETEADEEEEEEVVAGLEDFGFAIAKKKKNDDDDEEEDDEVDEEDLKHVVDDLSDDEGDEEEGERARKEMMKREEKEQHKEILRRMRDGYDGRRGGIAGNGVGARGIHRFDQLVAADNREDAKRLGLLNDDELESDDENENKSQKDDSGEIEDEVALLDKMLKDRFLHRSSVEMEENFSDYEEVDEDMEEEGKPENDEEAMEREQERIIAKRFAKRARMQRLIETHGEEQEFSQLRLIDEDESMKQELMTMKDVVGPKRRQTSVSSSSRASFSNQGSDSQLGGNNSNSQSLFSTQLSGSLTLALQASHPRKNKTSFLGGSEASKEKASAIHKCVALNHVVFHSENSQSRGVSQPKIQVGRAVAKNSKRKAATSSSLWDKVAANGFRKKRRF